MDKQSIYIGLIVVLLCIVPLILLWWKRQNSENQIKKMIKVQAEKKNCTLNKIGVTSSMAIGVDEAKKKVFFYKKEKDRELNLYVDLSEVSSCNLNKSQDYTDDATTVDHIDLIFNFKDKAKESLGFNFYGKNNISGLSDEFMLATEWDEFLTKLIRSK